MGPQQGLHHGAEARQPGLDLGLEAVLGAAEVDILEVGGVLRGGEHQQLLVPQVLHPQRFPARQGVGAVHDGEIRRRDAGLPGKAHPLHHRGLVKAGDEGVQCPGLQPGEELVGGHHVVAEAHLRAAALKGLQIRGLPAGDQGVRRPQGQAHLPVPPAQLRLPHGDGEGVHQPLPALVEVLPRLRQGQLPPSPVEEGKAQGALHPGDGLADGGLSGVEEGGGGGEAAELRRPQEELDLVQREVSEGHGKQLLSFLSILTEEAPRRKGKIPTGNPPCQSLALQTWSDLLSYSPERAAGDCESPRDTLSLQFPRRAASSHGETAFRRI